MRRKLAIIYTISLCLAAASLASVYSAGNASQLSPGQILQVWSAEQPTPGNGTTAASLAVVMASGPTGSPFHAHGFFSGAPGAFEIDVQVADDDVDTHYQTILNGNITTVDATNNTFHFDATLSSARFGRLLLRSRANAVNVTATIGR